MFSLKSPHGGISNEYTQHTINIYMYKKENHPKLSQIQYKGTNGKLIILGVPILKHITVLFQQVAKWDFQGGQFKGGEPTSRHHANNG